MTIDNILALGRDLTHTTVAQISATLWLSFLNIVYHDLENAIITKINEDYFWDEFTTDTVADQNEYVLSASSATDTWIRKITYCDLKWSATDNNYSRIEQNTTSNRRRALDFQRDNTTQAWGYFELREWSLFIYPTPTEAVTNWLKVWAVKTLIDLVWGWAETLVFPNQTELRQFHHALAIGMKQYIYSYQREFGEKDNAIVEWENEKRKVLDFLSDRSWKPVVWELPGWRYLMI